ncbi:MAG: hypothetical protein A3F46_11360 [Legionellales bacterium RIFCSPHIGHO2_12_FULL_42_9]|nr:MAG: hypothetical protein A3F46_11360 [Legionellales bacterium RIFCSPHIGHO2_12_FULL_42_9]
MESSNERTGIMDSALEIYNKLYNNNTGLKDITNGQIKKLYNNYLVSIKGLSLSSQEEQNHFVTYPEHIAQVIPPPAAVDNWRSYFNYLQLFIPAIRLNPEYIKNINLTCENPALQTAGLYKLLNIINERKNTTSTTEEQEIISRNLKEYTSHMSNIQIRQMYLAMHADLDGPKKRLIEGLKPSSHGTSGLNFEHSVISAQTYKEFCGIYMQRNQPVALDAGSNEYAFLTYQYFRMAESQYDQSDNLGGGGKYIRTIVYEALGMKQDEKIPQTPGSHLYPIDLDACKKRLASNKADPDIVTTLKQLFLMRNNPSYQSKQLEIDSIIVIMISQTKAREDIQELNKQLAIKNGSTANALSNGQSESGQQELCGQVKGSIIKTIEEQGFSEEDKKKMPMQDINDAKNPNELSVVLNDFASQIKASSTRNSKWNILLGVVTLGIATLIQAMASALGKDLWIKANTQQYKEKLTYIKSEPGSEEPVINKIK